MESLASPQHAAAKREADRRIKWNDLKAREFDLDMLRHKIERLDGIHRANIRATLKGESSTPLTETLNDWIKAQTDWADAAFALRRDRAGFIEGLLAEIARLEGVARA